MKKNILTLVMVFILGFMNAQERKMGKNSGQTSEGKWLIEANTGFGTPVGANTSLSYSTTDKNSVFNVGAEVGYFIIDDLAIKVGLGEGVINGDNFIPNTNIFSYKIGAKYYVLSRIPFQVDWSGATIKHFNEDASYLGIQGGYAWFLGSNVSIEPGVRYNISLNNGFSNKDTFQFNIGFALHF